MNYGLSCMRPTYVCTVCVLSTRMYFLWRPLCYRGLTNPEHHSLIFVDLAIRRAGDDATLAEPSEVLADIFLSRCNQPQSTIFRSNQHGSLEYGSTESHIRFPTDQSLLEFGDFAHMHYSIGFQLYDPMMSLVTMKSTDRG